MSWVVRAELEHASGWVVTGEEPVTDYNTGLNMIVVSAAACKSGVEVGVRWTVQWCE